MKQWLHLMTVSLLATTTALGWIRKTYSLLNLSENNSNRHFIAANHFTTSLMMKSIIISLHVYDICVANGVLRDVQYITEQIHTASHPPCSARSAQMQFGRCLCKARWQYSRKARSVVLRITPQTVRVRIQQGNTIKGLLETVCPFYTEEIEAQHGNGEDQSRNSNLIFGLHRCCT